MPRRATLTWFLLAACGGASPPSPEPSAVNTTASVPAPAPTPAPSTPPNAATCVPPPADAGSPKGAFVLALGDRDVRLYRLNAAGCATLVATIDPGGRVAIGSIREAQVDRMPDLSIDTWLYHGARRRQHFTWSGSRYIETGPEVEIPPFRHPRSP